MRLPFPGERVSLRGLIEFGIASISLPLGVYLFRMAGRVYLGPPSASAPPFLSGFLALIACGYCLFGIVRRGEYPWILGFAAVALPFFEPSRAPYGAGDRVLMAIRDLVLVGGAVVFLARAIARADELERRTHLEALSWSFSIVVVALVCHALVEDVLPPLRGTWVASGMLATWFIAWIAAWARYQR